MTVPNPRRAAVRERTAHCAQIGLSIPLPCQPHGTELKVLQFIMVIMTDTRRKVNSRTTGSGDFRQTGCRIQTGTYRLNLRMRSTAFSVFSRLPNAVRRK